MTSPFYENDRESLRRRADKIDEHANVPSLFLANGATTLRVLPTWKPGGVYVKEISDHFIRVNNRATFITCTEGSGPCACCEEYDRLISLGDDASLAAAEDLNTRRRSLFNVVFIQATGDHKYKPGEVYVLKAPITVANDIVRMDVDEAGDWYDVTSVVHGVNLRISRDGQGVNTRYSVLPAGARTGIVDYLASIGVRKTLDQLFSEMHDLDAAFPPRSYEEVKALIAQANRQHRGPRPADIPVASPKPPAATVPVQSPGVVPPAPVPAPPVPAQTTQPVPPPPAPPAPPVPVPAPPDGGGE